MNIGLFADCYKPTVTGVVTSLLQLKQGLEQRGHKVVVFAPTTPGCPEEESSVRFFPSLPFNRASEFRFGLVSPRAVQRIVREEKLKVVHTHTEYSLGWAGKKAARRMGLPFLHTVHTLHEAYHHYLPMGRAVPTRLVQHYLRSYLSGCDVLICPSEKARATFESFLPGQNATVIGNGVSPSSFVPQPCSQEQVAKGRLELGLGATDQVMLYVGRIAREKRVVELLDALAPMLQARPQVKLLFVGSGPADRDLASAVERYCLAHKVVLAGRAEWQQMYRYYSMAHVFVTASLSEIHPMTLIEASMCGLPAVVRRDLAYEGLVHEEYNGHLVPSDRFIADRAGDLLDDEEKRRRFSENARALSEEFGAESHVRQLEDLYRQVLVKKST